MSSDGILRVGGSGRRLTSRRRWFGEAALWPDPLASERRAGAEQPLCAVVLTRLERRDLGRARAEGLRDDGGVVEVRHVGEERDDPRELIFRGEIDERARAAPEVGAGFDA